MFIDGKTELLKDEFESNPTIGAFIDGSPFRFIQDKYVVPHQHRNKETMQSCSWLNGAWFMFKDTKERIESEGLILAPLELDIYIAREMAYKSYSDATELNLHDYSGMTAIQVLDHKERWVEYKARELQAKYRVFTKKLNGEDQRRPDI